MTDHYDQLAEFHDLFMVEPWEKLRPSVASVFSDLTSDAVIAEIGAGTGMGTLVLAEESSARVMALEPNQVMRTALMIRVTTVPGLDERVTVVAGSAPDDLGLLKGSIDGFVCAHMLGHLDRPARMKLFAWLDRTLSDEGLGLVTFQLVDPGWDHTTNEVVETRRVGEYEYRAVHHLDTGKDMFSTRYEVWDGDEMLRSVGVEGVWRPVTLDELEAELAGTSLKIRQIADQVAAVGRA